MVDPSRSNVEEQLGKAGVYSWEEGLLRSELLNEAVNNLHANPALLRNVKELCRFQATLPGVVADLVWAMKEGRQPSEAKQRVKSAEFKYFCDCWDSLRFNSDGLLTITLAAGTDCSERERLVCPSALRRELIWETDRQAHIGAGPVTRCLQLQWFWPGMTRDVRFRVRKCEVCQASKHGCSTETAGRRRLHAGRPWQVVAVNLVGPMPTTARGNNWILVLTDHFTRWADALIIPVASAPLVARTLDQQVFCYFGLPEQIHSDQGAQFQSQLMSDLCKLWGVNQSQTTPYHPQENRVVEQNNRMQGTH